MKLKMRNNRLCQGYCRPKELTFESEYASIGLHQIFTTNRSTAYRELKVDGHETRAKSLFQMKFIRLMVCIERSCCSVFNNSNPNTHNFLCIFCKCCQCVIHVRCDDIGVEPVCSQKGIIYIFWYWLHFIFVSPKSNGSEIILCKISHLVFPSDNHCHLFPWVCHIR